MKVQSMSSLFSTPLLMKRWNASGVQRLAAPQVTAAAAGAGLGWLAWPAPHEEIRGLLLGCSLVAASGLP